MSLHLPARRVAQAARATAGKPSLHLQYLLPRTQRRNAWFNWGSSSDSKGPVAKELTKRERQEKLAARMFDRTSGSSIFDEEIKDPGKKTEKRRDPRAAMEEGISMGYSKMKEHMERALDPDPRWRIRYQKKKVMQMVRAEGRLTKAERIQKTEKECTSKSSSLPTSTKKLVKLSHQIVGKTVDDALNQMRFSKKKMAREVEWQLEEARDTAIARQGMGLGVHNGEILKAPKKILTKDKKWIEVQDPTRLYVDQAWVGKGPWRGARVQYHARGRMSLMWRPSTSITLVLKEEKTRIRQHDERVEKQAKKAPWVHLPNRPVTAQRPYYSW